VSANEPEPDSRAHAPEVVHVALGARSYDILVGPGLLADAGDHIAPLLKLPRTVLVADENVAPLYLGAVEQSLARHDIACDSITVPPGEASKSFSALEALLDRLLANRAERGLTMLALGGGVVGDLAGFAASVLLRGLDVIQLPTSLLAQIDSSVGGKTGINSSHGKNLIGSFHQPRLVLADTAALDSLAPRELAAGYGEMVKYGLIDDADFFAWLEAHGDAVLAGDDTAQRHAIAHCCRTKARIVAEDEHETGRRALLNLGHTFGHAFEAECGYDGALLHGEAVAIGMVLAFRLSHRLGFSSAEDGARVTAHLAAHGLPTEAARLPPAARRRDALLEHMRHDKKVTDGRLNLILARGIGEAFIASNVAQQEIAAVLDDFLGAADGSQSTNLSS